jgi:putative PEP-CTERM system histidine kinase
MTAPLDIGLYSYTAAFLAYGLTSALIAVAWRNRPFHLSVLVACVFTAFWAGTIAVSSQLPYPAVTLMQLAEVLRNAAWAFVLLKYIAAQLQGTDHVLNSGRLTIWFAFGLAGIISILFLLPGILSLPFALQNDVSFATWLAMATAVLLLLEQIYRNGTKTERWSSKYLCLGLGFVFAYDFFMYAEALLFRQLDPVLWQARGFVVVLSAPMLAISIARNTDWNLGIHVSRHVVFHSATLLATGIYLLLMAIAGYFIRFLGGTWGSVLQISFLCAAGLLLLVLLFSGKIRAQTRVWLSKHFFSYKYDYREEWLQFTEILANSENNIPDAVIQAMAKLANSPAGLLWARGEAKSFKLLAHWDMPEPEETGDLRILADWLESIQWIIDIDEWRREPDIYENLDIPQSILDIPKGWLIVPLLFNARLQGVLLLRRSEIDGDINWEDRDLLKVAGRQAASHLAQYQASQSLVESRQFEAFNRLSAYVVHDLKNILAQQSLIVTNAEKHKHKPEFIDDVIATVGNSVARMTSLMEQMRSGVRGMAPLDVNLPDILKETVKHRSNQVPVPTFEYQGVDLVIQADSDQLANVFEHIIQNAQEATPKNGYVAIRLRHSGKLAIIEIEDNGTGMDKDFIRTRLYRPFDSTKGLTGMGIGAFESREFIRELGGDIQVASAPGEGSIFRIMLPCQTGQEESRDNDSGTGVKK